MNALRFARNSISHSIAASVLLSIGSSVHAAVILAMDGGGSSNTATSHSIVDDFSTDGDSIGSITGSFSSDNFNFANNVTLNWDASGPAFSPGNTNLSASWTISGLTVGSQWQVYSTWDPQTNRSTAAPYTINGGPVITVNQELAPDADLVIADPDGVGMGFQAIGGVVTVDGTGQIVVTQSGASDDWVMVDGLALSQVSTIPEPSTAILAGLALLGLCVRRRCIIREM